MRSLALALIACALAVAPASAAAPRTFTVRGAPAAGPAKYDRTYVEAFGPRSAKRVLILVPGFQGGAGEFKLVAREIAARVPGLQVWAWDRREQALEDTSGFATGNPDTAFGYYFGGKTLEGRRFTPFTAATAPFARSWGLEVELRDLRNVVLKARAGGRRQVILGGHSLGAEAAMDYSVWDFGGHAGWRDLTGLVLIDGAQLQRSPPPLATVRRQLADLAKGDPFADLLKVGLPWIAGVFAEIGSQYARVAPNAPSVLQQFPLVPSQFKPPVRVTNEAELGYAFDAKTSPPALRLLHIDSGSLAATGDPRPWRNNGVTPIQRMAAAFGTEPVNGAEWYFPSRLLLDEGAVSSLEPTSATRLLGLHPKHLAEVRVPVYAFQTSLSNGRILAGVRRFVKRSRVPRATLVDAPRFNHLDPVVAAPARNRMLTTVVPFLRALR